MSQRTAFITGANGAIGQEMCKAFRDAGWQIIGSDQNETTESPTDTYVAIDLVRLCRDSAYQTEKLACLLLELTDTGLHVLINNAATQIVAPFEELTANHWHTTIDVNLIAPFLLTQALLSELKKAKGSVINIASIHAQLTKPYFSAYATSKAALVGLTRSMAVELGNRIRVNAICPAAIATPMLKEGFNDDPQGLAQLASYHPCDSIGTSREVAESALYLAESKGRFLNGSIIELSGGISGRLHDPI